MPLQVASLVYIIALQFLAGLLVWLLIWSVWILLVLCTVIAFVKGGNFLDLASRSTNLATISASASTSSDTERMISEAIGYVLMVMSLGFFCMVCALSDRIGLAIQVIKVAGKTIRMTKLLFLVPVVNWCCLIALSAYAFVGYALIYTTEFSTADLNLAIDSIADCAATDSECLAAAIAGGAASNSDGSGDGSDTTTLLVEEVVERMANGTSVSVVSAEESLWWPMMYWHVFCALWCMNLCECPSSRLCRLSAPSSQPAIYHGTPRFLLSRDQTRGRFCLRSGLCAYCGQTTRSAR